MGVSPSLFNVCLKSPADLFTFFIYSDTVVLIWDEAITSQFTNSDLTAARLPDSFETDNFDKLSRKVGDVVARATLSRQSHQTGLLEALLQGAVKNQLKGTYNKLYRNSLYVNGLDHPDTIRLGQM